MSIDLKDIIRKTFGGITTQYVIRQYVFAALFIIGYFQLTGIHTPDGSLRESIPYFIVAGLLYPWSRFAYEYIVSYLMGNNIAIIPVIILIPAKIISMFFCLMFAPMITPIVMVVLHFYHTNGLKKNSPE